jgi:hypothetical protein
VDANGLILAMKILQPGTGYGNGSANLEGGNGTGGTIGITTGTFTAASRINMWMRDAYINLTMSNRFPGTEETITLKTVQGKSVYNFPETVRAIEALTLYRPDGTVITCETKDMKYIRRMNNVNQAAPSMWCEYGNQIHFRPVPDGKGPYTIVLDVWTKPLINSPLDATLIVMPLDWLEVLDYETAARGHTEMQEEDKAHAIQAMLYGYSDPATGKYTPGLVQNLQNRLQASGAFKDYGIQPQGRTQSFTGRR